MSCLTAATLVLVLEIGSVTLLEGSHYIGLLRHGTTAVGLWVTYACVYLGLGIIVWAVNWLLLRKRSSHRPASVLLLLVVFLVPGVNAMFVTRPVIGSFLTGSPLLIAVCILALLLAGWLTLAALRKHDRPPRLVASVLVVALVSISVVNGFINLRLASQITSFEGIGGFSLAVLGGCLVGLPMLLSCWRTLRAPAAKSLTVAFVFYAALCAGIVVLVPNAPAKPSPLQSDQTHRLSSILLIVIDTLRWDVVSGPEDSLGLTPNIGRLGRDSVWFESAYATSPWTLPSFGSILTSVYPSRHQAGTKDPKLEFNYPLTTAIPTLAEILSEAGYWTAAAATNPFLSKRYRLDRGFDVYRNLVPAWTYHPVVAGVRGRGLLPADERFYLAAEEQTSRVRALIRYSTGMDRPFFIMAHYMDPHAPYNAPELLGNAPRKTEDPFDHYRAEVAYCDHFIGVLLEDLREQGIYEEMTIFVVSDHGEEFFEERLGRRCIDHGHTLYNELIHVPFLVKLPGNRNGGSRRTDTVSLINVAPTLLDVAGVTAPETFDGWSLIEKDTVETRAVFSEATNVPPEQKAVVRGSDKIILRKLPPDLERAEAYDLLSDEHEKRPLAWDAAALRFVDLYLLLENFVKTRGTPSDSSTVDIDPHLLKQLKSLGYINQ